MEIDHNFRNRIHKEFASESDRGCAILTVCFLEETLIKLFSKVLPDGDASVRTFMPRGRLSLGLETASALGFISEPNVSNIKRILKVRNIFAHKLMEGLTFESADIKNIVMNMTLPNLDHVSNETKLQIQNNSRERYMEVLWMETYNIITITSFAEKFKKYTPLPYGIIEV